MFTGKHHSDESKAKIREATTGVRNPFYGKRHSDESKTKMREAKCGARHPNFGKHLSDTTKAKIREAKFGERNASWKGDEASPKAGRDRARQRFKCPKGKERHHIDGNPLNNAPENIMIVTRKQHMIVDGRIKL